MRSIKRDKCDGSDGEGCKRQPKHAYSDSHGNNLCRRCFVDAMLVEIAEKISIIYQNTPHAEVTK